MEIKEIGIRKLNIPEVSVFDVNTPPTSIPIAPPVVVNIGVPIINIPGCVEAHETNNPKNNQIKSDDPKGTLTFCDSGLPSYDPIQFEPEQLIPTTPAGIPKTDTPDKPKPEILKPPPIKPPTINSAIIQCPTREQELLNPVGKVLEGNKKIVGYELVGEKCIEITEKLNIPQQIITSLPNAGMVTTTASIAVVATTSALMAKPLADILLKVVKPTVKKIIKKIAAIRGKKAEILSVKERQDQQRLYSHALRKLKGKE